MAVALSLVLLMIPIVVRNTEEMLRVVRLVEDRILAENISMQAACKIVAPKLGVSWHTARQWTQAARRE